MKSNSLKGLPYSWLFFSLFVVYLLGLFAPMIDEDCTHHANIALHIFLYHDYINLIDHGKDYLDKPHLHFWLSALSYQLFGVSQFAYRLPSVLLSFLGIYSTYRLGKLLYNQETGLLAALILASAQAFILANIDVRMDAILTAAIIFAIWQLTEAVYQNKWYNYLLGALGLAMGFSTKGMVGLVMPCIALFCLLVYQRNWKAFLNPKWLLTIFYFIIFIIPELYAYYVQFDLHPEKVIRVMTHISGVKFILWTQNFERMEGANWGKAEVDYFFFFHTLIWAFLPWSLLTYHAIFDKIIFFIKNKFSYQAGAEFLVLGTIILIFTIISTSRYKLPHYLNIIFPLLAILTASQFKHISQQQKLKTAQIYLGIQYFVMLVCFLIIAGISFWVFLVQSYFIIGLVMVALLFLIYTIIKEQDIINKTIVVSVLTSVIINILMNGNFYPQIVQYDSGTTLSAYVNEKQIPKNQIYTYKIHQYTFDFYTQHLSPEISLQKIQTERNPIWILTDADGFEALSKEVKITKSITKPEYGITNLKAKFLNPNTRNKSLTANFLIRIN